MRVGSDGWESRSTNPCKLEARAGGSRRVRPWSGSRLVPANRHLSLQPVCDQINPAHQRAHQAGLPMYDPLAPLSGQQGPSSPAWPASPHDPSDLPPHLSPSTPSSSVFRQQQARQTPLVKPEEISRTASSSQTLGNDLCDRCVTDARPHLYEHSRSTASRSLPSCRPQPCTRPIRPRFHPSCASRS